MDELKLTIQEAQEILLLSQSSVYSWIDKGKLRSIETPGGKIIVISRKEAEEIKNFNLKSRRNKASKLITKKNSTDNAEFSEEPGALINAEILENQSGTDITGEVGEVKSFGVKSGDDITLRLISKIEELALEAGRFKQLEILRNEEKENVKFWQEKYHELSAELKKKDYEIDALKAQIELIKAKSQNPIFSIFKKH